MGTEQDQIRSVAERIARRLSSTTATAEEHEAGSAEASGGGDLSALRAGLTELQKRLAHIEAHISHDEGCETAARASDDAGDDPPRGESMRSRQENGSAGGATATPARSLWLSGTYVPAVAHPSEERFGIGEAVTELVDYFEREKTCTVEPGGKPCDHCGMCSSRGF